VEEKKEGNTIKKNEDSPTITFFFFLIAKHLHLSMMFLQLSLPHVSAFTHGAKLS